MVKCKITVLKTTFNKELVDQYVEKERKKTLGPCEVFTEGQEFIVEHIEKMPEGFCGWAWRDIYKDLSVLYFDGNFYGHEEGVQHVSCSDGRKPVCFKLERISD